MISPYYPVYQESVLLKSNNSFQNTPLEQYDKSLEDDTNVRNYNREQYYKSSLLMLEIFVTLYIAIIFLPIYILYILFGWLMPKTTSK